MTFLKSKVNVIIANNKKEEIKMESVGFKINTTLKEEDESKEGDESKENCN